MDCIFCDRKETKYSCIICGNTVCNICSKVVNDEDEGYDEMNYRVGKCPRNMCKVKEVNSGNGDVNSDIVNSDNVKYGSVNKVNESEVKDIVMAEVRDEAFNEINKPKKRKIGTKEGKPVNIFNFFGVPKPTDSSMLGKRCNKTLGKQGGKITHLR